MLINFPAAPLYHQPYAAELDDEAWYGQQAEITDDMGEFCRVRMEYGYESCIRRRYLAPGEYKGGTMTVRAPFADVRAQPDIKAALLMTLPRGALAEPAGEKGDWTQLRLIDGRTGYVISRALEGRRPPRKEEELRKDIVACAMEYLGVQYRWGGRTSLGVDCSGLCHSAYLLNGIAIYRNASIQPGYPVRSISLACAREGDLLYFPGHMAMYLGEGSYIHASAKAGRVCINSLEQGSPLYRGDLADSLICAGSVFCGEGLL